MLQFAIENGMIDESTIQKNMEMNERKKILEKHPYKIWEGKDGNWYTYLPDKDKKRKQIKRKTEKDLKDIVIDFWREELENPTVDEVFQEWNERRLELKKISHASYTRNEQFYKRHYKEFGKLKIKSLCWEDFEEFLEEQIPKYNLTAKAYAGLKGVTVGFLKRAKKRKLIDFNVVSCVNEMDVSETEFKKTIKEDNQEVYDDEEFVKIAKYLTSNLDLHNMGILLLFVTGLRIGELVTLKPTDIKDNTITVRRTETRIRYDGYSVFDVKEFPKTKAGARTVVVPKDYFWLVKRILHQNPFGEYLFEREDGTRLSSNCIRKRLMTINKKLGIVQKSPHKIRKTYGSILLDNKIDNKLVTDMMGHTNILCTENHYHRNRKTLEIKSDILSSIPEFQAL